MVKEDDRQAALVEYETKPVQLTIEAYAILRAVKNQLVKKYKRNHTFSDAVLELKNKRKDVNIEFSQAEVAQIKTTLKGGLRK